MAAVATSGANAQLDPLGVALGTLFETYPAMAASNQLAPPTQLVLGAAVYANQGVSVTGIKIRNGVAAAGALPTTVRFGLADNTGKILILSGNLNALASWPTGVCPMAFTAPFTLTYSGLYFLCFVVNGVWGATQPTPNLTSVSNGAAMVADGANPPVNFQWAAQTDLPAVGASLTMATGSTRSYWMALY